MAGRILCVDADRQQCSNVARALDDAGYKVRSAHEGDEALELIEAGDIDLLIIDVKLPRSAGHPSGFGILEAMRELPGALAEVPVLLASKAKPTPEYKQQAKKLRAKAILGKPIALDRLVDVVKRHIKESPPSVHETRARQAASGDESPTSHEKRQQHKQRSELEPPELASDPADSSPDIVSGAMQLEGKLRDHPLPMLLHRIHELRASGALMLTTGNKKKAIQLRDGYPVAVKSNLVGECLGNFLVKRGAIDREVCDESLLRMKQGEGMHGEILVAMNVLDEQTLADAIRDHAAEKLYELFEWPGGSFKFEVGARLRKANSLALDASPANVIMEGVRRRYPIDRIDRFLAARSGCFVVRSENPFLRLQEVDLTGSEINLLERLESSPSVAAVACGDEGDRRSLFALLAAGLVEVNGEPEKVTTAQPSRRSQVGRDVSLTAPLPMGDRELRAELAATAEKLRKQSFFEMLCVSPTDSDEAIREAFEERAQRFHPDRFTQASNAVRQLADEVFQRLERAHGTLSDPKLSQEYQQELNKGEQEAAQAAESRRELDAEVEFQRGESLLRKRSYEAALICFGNALQRAPEEGEYHAHYGWALYCIHPDESAMVEEAIEHVRRAIKLARDNEKPYLFLGRLYKATGRLGPAEKMFTRAVQVRPDSVEALRELRLITMRREKSRGLIGRLLRR